MLRALLIVTVAVILTAITAKTMMADDRCTLNRTIGSDIEYVVTEHVVCNNFLIAVVENDDDGSVSVAIPAILRLQNGSTFYIRSDAADVETGLVVLK